MSLHLERIEWMPSPPLAPGDGPIDFEHLERMTLGDAAIEQEVLTLFSAQSAKTRAHARCHACGCQRAGAYAQGLGPRDRRFCRRRCRRPAGGGHRQRLRYVRCARELGETVAQARAAIEAVLRRS
jgi:hypothetical protein